ncbi:HNH endonuclease [Mycolicibacterium septicum]|nr:HNH endonuclease [Mycolicibacterium septicum]
MAWENGKTGSNIPKRIKAAVRRRDQVCQLNYEGCVGQDPSYPSFEFDHIVNLKAAKIPRNQANKVELLQLACKPCHKVKTQAEAKAGSRRHLRTLINPGLAQ